MEDMNQNIKSVCLNLFDEISIYFNKINNFLKMVSLFKMLVLNKKNNFLFILRNKSYPLLKKYYNEFKNYNPKSFSFILLNFFANV